MMGDVNLKSSFAEILGPNSDRFTEAERKQRWEVWRKIAGPDISAWWDDTEGCEDCIYLDGRWCDLVGLPCTVNPYLSFNHGMPGMACMGTGKQTKGQKVLL